jgi:hypothetical protein
MNQPLHPELTAVDGTCIQLIEGEPVWMVRGRSGWYYVNEEAGSCSCAQWKYRTSRALTPCRHQRSLAEYLRLAETLRSLMIIAPGQETAPEPLPSDAELRAIFS